MTLRVSGQAAWRKIGDETVVLNLRARRVLGLNAAGGEVWAVLAATADPTNGPVSTRPLAGPPPEALREFLADLEAEGLLARDPDAATPDGPPLELDVRGIPAVAWREEMTKAVNQGFSCIKFEGNTQCEGGSSF